MKGYTANSFSFYHFITMTPKLTIYSCYYMVTLAGMPYRFQQQYISVRINININKKHSRIWL